jgi:zinc transport system substrate-binding protein
MRCLRSAASAGILVALWAGTLGCGESTPSIERKTGDTSGPLVVYTVNEPLRYFAKRVGGDAVEAVLPAPAGVDPAFWLPEPEDVIDYQQADLILLAGAGYARWIDYALLPQRTQVDTSAGFHDRLIALGGHVRHSHGPTAEDSHGANAITSWLDLELAALQARAVADALVRMRPSLEPQIEARWSGLKSDLDRLDARLLEIGASFTGAPMLFSHPVYQYLERRYGLAGYSLHWEPDQDPGEDEWARLAARQQRSPATWMLWEAEPLPATVRRLAELGIEPVVFAPGGGADSSGADKGGDWLAKMAANVGRLEAAALTRESED